MTIQGEVMHLVNMEIERIIIHQVYQRDEDGKRVAPLQSHEFTRFESSAMNEFKARVRDALGDDSKAVQMEIVNQSPRDLVTLIDVMSEQEDEDFAVSSYDIATKLTEAQQRKSIPGGIVVVFQGKQGHPQTDFLGVIKAEVHSGYQKEQDPKTKEISLKFVEEVLLTPGQRLYKTAAFFKKPNHADDEKDDHDMNDKWVVMVSDYQISKADGKAAAEYFYSDFLGCGYPQTSARTTKHFFDATKDFIKDLDASVEEKYDLFNALTTYLKVDTSSSISASDFAEKYFEDIDTQDDYVAYIKALDLPTTSFTKDTKHIESSLKMRKVSFGGKVKLTAPSDAFLDLVSIETIEGEPNEVGEAKEWTKIIIKDKVVNQE